jgi:hypothetical protein
MWHLPRHGNRPCREYFGDYLELRPRRNGLPQFWTITATSVAQTSFLLSPRTRTGRTLHRLPSSHYNILRGVMGPARRNTERRNEGSIPANLGETPDSMSLSPRKPNPHTVHLDSMRISAIFFPGSRGQLQAVSGQSLGFGPNGARLILSYKPGQSDSADISYFTLQAHAPELRLPRMIVEISAGNNNRSSRPG